MVSPEGAAAAVAAGVGGVVEQALGGVRDSRFSEAYTVTGEVEKLFDGTFDIVKGHCAGMHNTMGQCATLKLLDGAGGADTGTRLILTTGIGCHFAAELFKLGGYDPCTSVSLLACVSVRLYEQNGSVPGSVLFSVRVCVCAHARSRC